MGAYNDFFPIARRPSPFPRRVGPHDCTFEACSGFTHVAACRVASPPKKRTFVPWASAGRLPEPTARVAKEVNHQFLPWYFQPLVNCALVAHWEIRDKAIFV